jgi:heptosyltransferase III
MMISDLTTVLIFRIGSLGDTVVALPCFHHVARSFPNSRRILITASSISQKDAPVESVLGDSGLIHGTIYFPPPPRKVRDFFILRRSIRQTRATTLIYVADRNPASTMRDICFFRTCGVRHIIGAPLARDLRHLRRNPVTGDTEREAERLARCLSALGPIDIEDPGNWDLKLQPNELCVADATLIPIRDHHFIALSLGSKDPAKDWGDENWLALLQMIAVRYSCIGLVFFGSNDEFKRSAAMGAQWNGPTLNLCGRLAPRESAAVMRRALFYLGHDSGAMHLAAVVGVPCVCVFGALNVPKLWHPIGRKHRIIHDMQGLDVIKPASVLAAVEMMMSELASQVSDKKSSCGDYGGLTPEAAAEHTTEILEH